jgi:aryl-alcohol dehydrogenase-like predicted oxidoreductase
MNIPRRTLGRTGLQVSCLGFGAAPAAFLNTDQNQLAKMLNEMLDAGVNVLDTAAMYPGSEAFIGNHLAARRKDYVLISKCGSKVAEIDAPPWSVKLISQSVDRALKLLKTDVLDVMLLHSCDKKYLEQGELLAELVKSRNAGKVRHVGYSGDNETVAYAAALPDVEVVETSINLVDQVSIDLLLPVAKKHHVGVIAKRPIANAAWKDLSQQPGFYSNYAKEYTDRLSKMHLKPADLGFSGSASQAWPELALRFTLSFPEVSTAIIGTTNPANARANLGYASSGPLGDDFVLKIRAAFRQADPERKWTGQT